MYYIYLTQPAHPHWYTRPQSFSSLLHLLWTCVIGLIGRIMVIRLTSPFSSLSLITHWYLLFTPTHLQAASTHTGIPPVYYTLNRFPHSFIFYELVRLTSPLSSLSHHSLIPTPHSSLILTHRQPAPTPVYPPSIVFLTPSLVSSHKQTNTWCSFP